MGVNVQFLSAKEAADLLGYTVAHIRTLASTGKIKAYKRGRAWLFKKNEIQDILIPNNKAADKENEDGLDI